MNRIPTEGLKHAKFNIGRLIRIGLNEQNPDRGIETVQDVGRQLLDKELE